MPDLARFWLCQIVIARLPKRLDFKLLVQPLQADDVAIGCAKPRSRQPDARAWTQCPSIMPQALRAEAILSSARNYGVRPPFLTPILEVKMADNPAQNSPSRSTAGAQSSGNDTIDALEKQITQLRREITKIN